MLASPGEDLVFGAEGFVPGSLVEVEQFGGIVGGGVYIANVVEFAGVGVGAC